MINKFIISLLLLSLSCVNVTSHAQDSIKLTKIAILPAEVKTIGNTGKLTTEKIYQAELSMSFIFQEKIFNWFLKNHKKFKNIFDVQDRRKTNDLLFSDGMDMKQYRNLDKDSLAKTLGVDQVFYCSSIIEAGVEGEDLFPFFPFVPNGGSVFGGMSFLGTPGSEMHKLTITLGVSDNKSFSPLWSQKYGHYNNGLNKLNDIFNRILKDASHHLLTNKK